VLVVTGGCCVMTGFVSSGEGVAVLTAEFSGLVVVTTSEFVLLFVFVIACSGVGSGVGETETAGVGVGVVSVVWVIIYHAIPPPAAAIMNRPNNAPRIPNSKAFDFFFCATG